MTDSQSSHRVRCTICHRVLAFVTLAERGFVVEKEPEHGHVESCFVGRFAAEDQTDYLRSETMALTN